MRGSTPAPGPQFVRYGGHTSCIAVRRGPDQAPQLILDAGTGLRMLTPLLQDAPLQGTILLSHLHWDHVQGLPFCAAADRPDSEVHVLLPQQAAGTSGAGASGRDLVASFMAPPAFPITPEGLLGRWDFTAIAPGSLDCRGFAVDAFDVAHKGGRTLGYRVEHAGRSLAYLPDHAPAAGVSPATLAGIRDVDLLIHDAQFLDSERARADDYGHATVQDAIDLALRAGARALLLFHHGPHRTDAAIDAIMAQVSARIPVTAARAGQAIDL